MNVKNNKKTFLLILSIAFILRIGYIFIFPQEKILVGDAVGYDTIAHNLANGSGFSMEPNIPTPIRAPGYPFFLSIIYLVFGHSYFIVRIFQAILSALTCVILYYTAKEIFDEKIAKVSAWLLLFYPVLIVYTGLILSETLFTFLFIITVFLLVKGLSSEKNKYFILSGLFLGLSTLTRPVTLLLPFLIFFLIIITNRNLLSKWLLFFTVFCIVLLPWSIRNYQKFGIITPCSTGSGFGIFVTGYMTAGHTWDAGVEKFIEMGTEFSKTRNYAGDEASVKLEKKAQKEGLHLIKKNLKNYIILVIKRLPGFWWTSHSSVFGVDKPISEYLQTKNYLHLSVRIGLLMLHGVFLILAFTGIILSVKNRQNCSMLILILIYFTGHILFDPCPRFYLPVMPYLVIFVVVPLKFLTEKLINGYCTFDKSTLLF